MSSEILTYVAGQASNPVLRMRDRVKGQNKVDKGSQLDKLQEHSGWIDGKTASFLIKVH